MKAIYKKLRSAVREGGACGYWAAYETLKGFDGSEYRKLALLTRVAASLRKPMIHYVDVNRRLEHLKRMGFREAASLHPVKLGSHKRRPLPR
ncbi:MAG: hypothetical protein ACK5MF_04075 [Vibrio sp.]|uniref:hypothetical protein n=1 Tax=Vibrio sp. TaxID=678 RepID=UPI003A872E8E